MRVPNKEAGYIQVTNSILFLKILYNVLLNFNENMENFVILLYNYCVYFYQETPFMKPYTTLEEINEEWQHITNENIKQIDFKILAIDNYTAIVEWYLEQNFEIYDGIYEIKFSKNLECIYFKS